MNDTQATFFQRILTGRKWWRDAAGLLLSTLGIITLITLLGWNAGGIISAWADFLRHAFGIGVFVFCIILIGLGVPLVLNTPFRIDADRLIQIIAGEMAFFALLALIHSLTFGADSFALIQAGSGGGAVGWVLSRLVWIMLGSEVGMARFISIAIWFIILAISATIAFRPLLQVAPRENGRVSQPDTHAAPFIEELTPPEKVDAALAIVPAEPELLLAAPKPVKPASEAPRPEPKPVTIKSHPTIIRPDTPKPEPAGKKAKAPVPHDDTLPPATLLKAVKDTRNNDADVKRQADIIETTLAQFGL
ncbi:MAG TPA: hypothetical protein VGK81_03615, partial [Anaerolineae bacterium]